MWPDHCVQNTKGSELHKDLVVKDNDIRIYKGQDPNVDSYSGFGTPPEDTGLEKELKNRNV